MFSKTYSIGFIVVATIIAASLLASANLALKDRQQANVEADKKKKILAAIGMPVEPGTPSPEVNKIFDENVLTIYVDTAGKEVEAPQGKFDHLKTLKTYSVHVNPVVKDPKATKDPLEGLVLELFAQKGEDGKPSAYVVPLYGKGLWGTMYGFLTLGGPQFNDIHALVFYEHIETPGLGGEVENPRWKALWDGKKVRDADGAYQIRVIKGSAPTDSLHEVDGLSGATITSRGVTNLLRFWLGDLGFGPFLSQLSRTPETTEGGQ